MSRAASVTLLVAAFVVGIFGFVAHASGPMTDGYYACSFTTGVDCQPTTIPTVTATATVTATETISASPSPTVSVTPSSPPPAKPLLGESFGGNVSGSTAAFPEQQIGRYFFSGAPGPLSTGLKAGETIIVSFKLDPAGVIAGTYDTTIKAAFASWATSGHPIIWAYEHEPENNGFTPAAFAQAYAHLLALAKPYPIKSAVIIMGDDVRTGVADTWYVPGTDYIGLDTYQLSNESLDLAWAKSKGKPVLFPEFGDGPAGSVTTDASALAYAKAFVAGWDTSVAGGCWFNGNNNLLANLPSTLAYLRTLP